MIDAFEQFSDELDPMLVERVRIWSRHRGLAPLLESLRTQIDRTRFMDIWIEAMVADRLMEAGWSLDTEVPTPSGRTCDLRASRGGETFYLHLKRLQEDEAPPRQLVLSPRLRVLEQIERPFLVRIRWREELDDEALQHLVVRASAFLHTARIGEELTVRDTDGIETGGVRVVGPWEGDHISLAIGLPGGFVDRSGRIRGLLQKAYEQFMPRAANVILVAGDRQDTAREFESAVLGTPEERWDRHPAAGARVAWGRAADGFWSGESRPESRLCGWCRFRPDLPLLQADVLERERPAPEDWLRESMVALR
ncbi:MAG: hypothetical protein MK101_09485 [Phycisphaerales bacterium]|nr:hypothetical protein [Phycisphaerales bacterium]